MPQPITTGDGSSSFYSEKYGEPYHSRHGAVQESLHVFIESGLMAWEGEKPSIHIFEMGMGTGLNVWLTCLHTARPAIRYTAIEAEPLPTDVWKSLNYPELQEDHTARDILKAIHECEWDTWQELSDDFLFRKLNVRLQDYDPDIKADVIYFDAFAPEAQPELWTEDIFRKLFEMMDPGGVLVTYSAKGAVRRAMIAAGLEAERIPGPPGKREMLRAWRK